MRRLSIPRDGYTPRDGQSDRQLRRQPSPRSSEHLGHAEGEGLPGREGPAPRAASPTGAAREAGRPRCPSALVQMAPGEVLRQRLPQRVGAATLPRGGRLTRRCHRRGPPFTRVRPGEPPEPPRRDPAQAGRRVGPGERPPRGRRGGPGAAGGGAATFGRPPPPLRAGNPPPDPLAARTLPWPSRPRSRATSAAVSRARACRQRAMRHRGEQTRCGRRSVRGWPQTAHRPGSSGVRTPPGTTSGWGQTEPLAGADAGA
jgi:hypothetical protein